MNKTALYDTHLKLSAKIVPFAGWEMPLSYPTGVIAEHHAVRNGVGLFDISHMGRFLLTGKGCETMLSKIVPSPSQKMKGGIAQYSMLLNDEGFVLDDIYIYKRGKDKIFLIVNASNREKDFLWLKSHLDESATLTDVTFETSLLALQGPKSWDVLERVIPFGKDTIELRTFIETEFLAAPGAASIVARTGYTGERGYEMMIPNSAVKKVWSALMKAGKEFGILPIGLGARDTLRLEKGYPLYGHELDEQTTPITAGLGMFLDFTKDFIGKEPLALEKEKGTREKKIGFVLMAGGVPREGHPIYSGSKEIGVVTSGNFSPSLKKGIGIARVDARFAAEGSEIFVNIHDRGVAAVIVKPPFYKKG